MADRELLNPNNAGWAFPESKVRSLFDSAGIKVLKVYELPNGYWPIAERYLALRADSPWWLVMTEVGPVTVGYRKSVMAIDWEDTPIRAVVTVDDVTKDETSVHAWTTLKAVEYLTALGKLIRDRVAQNKVEAELTQRLAAG